jgi:Arc/MetJ family transcription regulator
MRTTLDIDDDVMQAAKELATLHGKTAGQVVSDLVRKALAGDRRGGTRLRNGVPLIRRKPGSPLMTAALVNELRDEV